MRLAPSPLPHKALHSPPGYYRAWWWPGASETAFPLQRERTNIYIYIYIYICIRRKKGVRIYTNGKIPGGQIYVPRLEPTAPIRLADRNHTHENIAATITSVQNEWQVKQLSAVTTDNNKKKYSRVPAGLLFRLRRATTTPDKTRVANAVPCAVG